MYEYISLMIKLALVGILLVKTVKWLFRVPMLKRHFASFKNVVFNKDAHFLYGDYYDEVDENEVNIHIDFIKQNPDTDLYVKFEFMTPTVYLCSQQAIKEYKTMVPTKIDRCDQEGLIFGKLYTQSFDKSRTTQKWKKRHQVFFKHGAFKRVDNLIPVMVDTLDKRITEWTENEKMNFVDEFSDLALTTFLRVLLGEEFLNQIGVCNMIRADGAIEVMTFRAGLQWLSNELTIHGDTVKSSVFPWLNSLNLIEPFRTDKKNIDELYRVLAEYLTSDGKKDAFDIELLKVSERESSLFGIILHM